MDTAVYYFDTLPLRPRPQPLESFTSYLTRVAEANGKRYLSHLKPYIDLYVNISHFADYPPHSFGKLPTLTSCSESELLRTTFFHAGKKFSRLYHSRLLANFLIGLIAPTLRYCPFCLQDDPYYSLVWRFLPLGGCPKHACDLLEICGHCERQVPIFSSPLRIGICPACNKDLRLCTSSSLTEKKLQEVSMTFREIEFLLSPCSWETTEPFFLEKLGMEFSLLRHEKQLKPLDVIKQTTLSWRTLEAIEYGQSDTDRASLRWYLEYAHYFGVSLNSIFTTMLQREEGDRQVRSLRVKRFFLEDEVLEQVQEVVERLHMPGSIMTLKAISAATGISPQGLRKHPRVRDFLRGVLHEVRQGAEKRRPESEEELLAKAQQAVKALAESGEPITHTSVSLRIGIRPWTVVLYPIVKRFIQQHVDYASQQFRRTEMQEQALLEKVCSAVLDLKAHHQPVTYIAVSRSIGINYMVWSVYAQVRAFVDQNLDSMYLDRARRQEEREEALLPRVEEAIRQLEALSKPVTFQAVGKLLGMQPVTLKSYPRVSELVEQKGDSSLRRRQAGRSEEEVLVKVQRAIQGLTSRGQSITYRSVAREIGMGPDTLKTYAQVRVLLGEHLLSYHLYQRQQFSLREEELLSQVEEAIAELEALGIPVTQRAICAKIGRDRSVLKKYPRIKAVIVQKASGYHFYQRRSAQPVEGELMQKVEEAVANLVSLGEPVTQASIARRIRIRPEVLMLYPRVVALLEQHGYKKRQLGSERAEELFGRVQEAICECKTSGRPITKRELSRIVGVKCPTLFHYPSVRALMTQAVNEDRQQRLEIRFQEREDELTWQVVDAIQQLRDAGKKVSVKAVGRSVHVSPVCLLYYPKVSALLESAITTQCSDNSVAQN